MPSQLVKLAIIDNSGYRLPPFEEDGIDYEVFSVIQEGAQNASRQVVSIENDSVLVEGGREIYEQKTYTLDVVGMFDLQRRQKLFNWAKNRTRLIVCGYSLDGHYLYATGYITIVDGFEENASVHFRLSRSSVGGYNPITSRHNADFIFSKNMASLYAWQKPYGAYGTIGYDLLNWGFYPRFFTPGASFDNIKSQKPAGGLASIENILYNGDQLQYYGESLTIAQEEEPEVDFELLSKGALGSFDESTRYYQAYTTPSFIGDDGAPDPIVGLYTSVPFPFENVRVNYTCQIGQVTDIEDLEYSSVGVGIYLNSKANLHNTYRSNFISVNVNEHVNGQKYTASIVTDSNTFFLRFYYRMAPGYYAEMRNPMAWIGTNEPDYTEFYS